jgi:cobalt-zinc-cadmium efflux system protein
MPASACGPTFLSDVCRELHDRFEINHPTLQVDPEDAPHACKLAPEETL